MTKKKKYLLLCNLANILNACEKAGLEPKLLHDSVHTNYGYVLPVGQKRKWAVRLPKQKYRAEKKFTD